MSTRELGGVLVPVTNLNGFVTRSSDSSDILENMRKELSHWLVVGSGAGGCGELAIEVSWEVEAGAEVNAKDGKERAIFSPDLLGT